MILFSLNKYKQNCVVYIWYYSLGISTGSRTGLTGAFFSLPAASRLFSRGVIFTRARSTILEEKWGLLAVYDRVDSW